MEPWIIFALIAAVSTGLYGFSQKVESESTIKASSFIFYVQLGSIVVPLASVLMFDGNLWITPSVLIFSFVCSILYILVLKCRIASLRTLTSSAFFINYRIFSSMLLLVAGQMVFSEEISRNEYIGVWLWFIICYLLFDTQRAKTEKKDFLKWYMFLVLAVVLISSIWLLNKWFLQYSDNVSAYIFYSGVFGMLITLLLKWKDTMKEVLVIKNKKDAQFFFLAALSLVIANYTNMLALLSGWDIAIVYKIISYSLFVPIILSMIFYKEKLTLKKAIAFILTIISILLFV